MNVPFYLSLFSHHCKMFSCLWEYSCQFFCFQDVSSPCAAHQVVVFYFCSVRAKAFFRSPAILDCQTLFKNESRKGWLEAVVLAEGTGDPDLCRRMAQQTVEARKLWCRVFKSFLLGCSGATEKILTSSLQSGGSRAGCRGKSILGNLASLCLTQFHTKPPPPPLVVPESWWIPVSLSLGKNPAVFGWGSKWVAFWEWWRDLGVWLLLKQTFE